MKRFKVLGIIIVVLLMGMQVFGQRVTNKAALLKFSEEKAAEYKIRKAEALEYAKKNDIPVFIETEDSFMELMFIDEFGKPQYYITENTNSSATISTNKVNAGGGQGLNLDGSGMTVHEWDGGAVLATHQELTGRVVQGDGATVTHYHAAHVAGTLIASGVDAAAKGMAPSADLRAFDWSNDEAEMASEAANQNTLVSNHSYGFGRGWVVSNDSWYWNGTPSVSDQEDYLFGFYDWHAEDWDEIAYDAPYYLIVKAAGNDRGDGPDNPPYPLDGPYDCISHAGLSKNVLTVGAVNDIPGGYTQPSDVVMSSFSSWGPVDDGRIKPDIVTNGVGLYSTYNTADDSYASLSGTSMASPSATGSLILLQEHYENLNGTGNFMKSATLKALVLHTADEAGTNDGPDYSFGWGLMNTSKAAQKITEDQDANVIDELTLSDGNSHQIAVTASGNEPLVVTICWTEEPGTPVAASLDPPDVMLVNDLDLKITESSNTFYPWKLDKDNPSNAATRSGENNVDNVEMVTIDSPVANSTYTITIDHDGSLSGGSQDFSIIISGMANAPTTNFIASNQTPYTGNDIIFTDLTLNNPTSWSWTFSPSTITFLNGTDATSQNPEVEFNVAGTYDVELTATNSEGSDTETKTAYIVVTDVPLVTLPWSENFDDVGSTTTFTANTTSINGIPEWNFETTENGRLRFSAGADFYQSGDHAATLDANPSGTYSINYIIATLNLTNYASSTDLELSFSFMHHSEESHANDRVWIRGSENESWIEVYNLYTNRGTAGVWNAVTAIDIDNLLNTNSQTPTSSFQIRFGQEDNFPATSISASDGFTFDDIMVSGTAPLLPEADFSADLTSVNEGSNINYTDLTTNTPNSWSWTFPGGTPSTSTDQNPTVTYNTAGTYSVTLEATNANGSDTEVKTDYITVNSDVSYCAVTGSNYHKQWISQVDLNTFTKTSGGDGYSDFTSDIISLNEGSNSLSLTPAYSGTDFRVFFRIWIDWNTDGDFDDSGELVYDSPRTKITVSGSFDKPAGFSGNTQMRVGMQRTKWGSPEACTDIIDGEFEDYTVSFGGTPSPPVADFSASSTSVSEGGNVTFSDLSTNSPTSWAWTFEGGTPSSSTDQNPVVSYATAGTYDVTLVATNSEGSDTEIKLDYIDVSTGGSAVQLSFSDFETDWGIWTDGGLDCMRYTGGTYSYGGNASIDIQDDRGVESSFYMTSGEDVDSPAYIQIDVDFHFIAVSMDNSDEDFWVQYYDGTTWHTVADFDEGIDFDNGVFYNATVSILETDYTFPTDMKIRFMCDASANRDDIYIDDITISASTQLVSNENLIALNGIYQTDHMFDSHREETSIYPNPASDKLHIVSDADDDAIIMIHNISGQLIINQKLEVQNQTIDIGKLHKGIYIVTIKSNQEIFTEKLIKH